VAGQGVRARHLLTDHPDDAATLVDKAIAGCADDDVEEIQTLGRTLESWRTEILEHHNTGASNGPTEGLNLCVKKIKRCGHGFRSFEHYRLRVLLHAGGVTWPTRPQPPRTEPALPTRSRRAAKARAEDPNGLTKSELEELKRLRKENIELRTDREILRKAAA
jgi:hypothetical protein